jgi:hypothetical protein
MHARLHTLHTHTPLTRTSRAQVDQRRRVGVGVRQEQIKHEAAILVTVYDDVCEQYTCAPYTHHTRSRTACPQAR